MGKLLDFLKGSEARNRGRERRVADAERVRMDDFAARMVRIKCSLERINVLMKQLRELPREGDRDADKT